MSRPITITDYLSGRASRQRVFDFVMGKLIEQGEPSIDETGRRCMYRGPDGVKCAIGHLIPDRDYDTKMDLGGDNGVDEVIASFYKNCVHDNDKIEFLGELQMCHDSAAFSSDYFVQYMDKYARLKFGYLNLDVFENKK